MEAAQILGIFIGNNHNGRGPNIRWSGFSSQADGASFVGSYELPTTGSGLRDAMHAARITKKIREEFPGEERLWTIADKLYELQAKHGYQLRAAIGQHGNFCHDMTMDARVWVGEEDADDSEISEETEKAILDLMRDFAKWIYRNLEDEYESRLTDEYVDDTIMENEYKFTKDGKRAD
jgi:hypothetical protein